MLDINTVALIVMLNDPQASMGELNRAPNVGSWWPLGAVVLMLMAVALAALL